MVAPLSGKQSRENMKMLFEELRKTVALKKDQKRKDLSHEQSMRLKEESANAEREVPPIQGKPTNPEAGPSDTVPAMLTPGEAVIPASAAQNPKNKPIIKALVREGRSDKTMNVPKMGYADGTVQVLNLNQGIPEVKGYALGEIEVEEANKYNQDNGGTGIYDSEGYTDKNGTFFPYEAPITDASTSTVPPVIDTAKLKAQEQTANDRKVIGNLGNRIAATVAAPVDVALGGYNAAATGLDKAVNAFNESRLGRLFGADAYEMNIPKVGKGEFIMPLSEKVKRLEAQSEVPAAPEKNKLEGGSVANSNGEIVSGSGATVATRNNNPGNLRYGAELDPKTNTWVDNGKRLDGQVGVDLKTGFAIFPDHELGRKALENQISLDTQKRGMPLNEFISKYAPAADKNNPRKYADTIAKELGIKSTDYITPDQISKVADVITRVESGGKYVPNATVANVPSVGERSDKPVTDTKEVPKVEIPSQVETAMYPPKTAMQPESWMSFLKEGTKNTANKIIDTITDPNKATAALSSFFRDTLNLTTGDAAKFASMYYAQRALGFRSKGSLEFAGKNMISNMDQRTQHEARMLEKGYVKNDQGQIVPGNLINQGEVKILTFSTGPNAHKEFSFTKHIQGGTGKVFWTDAQGRTPEVIQAQIGDGRVFRPQVASDLPEARVAAFDKWQDGVGQTSEKTLEIAFPTQKDKPNTMRQGIPNGRVIGEQSRSAFKAWGYNPDNTDMFDTMNNMVSQATSKMIAARRLQPQAEIPSIEPFLSNEILRAKTGIDNTLFVSKTSGELTDNNKIADQKERLETALYRANKDLQPPAIQDKLIDTYKQLQKTWADPNVQKLYPDSDKESGFYRYVNAYIKANQK